MTALSKIARVAGLLYIVASLVGIVRLLYIPNLLFVHGDAAATASNIARSFGSASPRISSAESCGCSFRWRSIDCSRTWTAILRC